MLDYHTVIVTKTKFDTFDNDPYGSDTKLSLLSIAFKQIFGLKFKLRFVSINFFI